VGDPAKSLSSPARLRALRDQLFARPDLRVYGILDAASIKDLLPKLADQAPNHACLFAGKLDPSDAQTAPYVVELEPGAEFTQWVLENGWGKHWGIFATSAAPLKAVRKHLKTFLLVTAPGGRQLYFRYYDPRVFRAYLPTCNPEETELVFGPVLSFSMEDEAAENLLVFEPAPDGPRQRTSSLD
jgi:hypothetical protein